MRAYYNSRRFSVRRAYHSTTQAMIAQATSGIRKIHTPLATITVNMKTNHVGTAVNVIAMIQRVAFFTSMYSSVLPSHLFHYSNTLTTLSISGCTPLAPQSNAGSLLITTSVSVRGAGARDTCAPSGTTAARGRARGR